MHEHTIAAGGFAYSHTLWVQAYLNNGKRPGRERQVHTTGTHLQCRQPHTASSKSHHHQIIPVEERLGAAKYVICNGYNIFFQ